MVNGKGKKIHLGARWKTIPGESDFRLSDHLVRTVKDIPLHWNVPALPAGSTDPILPTMRERIRHGADTVAAMGFAGSIIPLLSAEELEREISWCVRNQWKTGIADLFGTDPRTIIPRIPDLDRSGFMDLLRKHGFQALGVLDRWDKTGSQTPFLLGGTKGIEVFRCYKIPDPAILAPSQRLLRDLLARNEEIYLLFDFSRFPDARAGIRFIDSTCDYLFRNKELRFTAFAPAKAEKPPLSPLPIADGWQDFALPILRCNARTAEKIRSKKRKKAGDYRNLLSLFAADAALPDASEEQAATEGFFPKKRTLVAHMQGEIALSGPDFDVTLREGCFMGITSSGRPVLPVRPSLSYIKTDRVFHRYRMKSAFSFEGEASSGLRAEFVPERFPDGKLSIDYYFVEGFSPLIISGIITYPSLRQIARVDEFAPFALALCELEGSDEPEITVVRANGSWHKRRMNRNDGAWVLLPGTEYRISVGGSRVVFGYLAPSGRSQGYCLFRIMRKGKFGKARLEANPFGSYCPVSPSFLNGREEAFSLYLSLEPVEAKVALPALPPSLHDRAIS